jgi:hypothetical protein
MKLTKTLLITFIITCCISAQVKEKPEDSSGAPELKKDLLLSMAGLYSPGKRSLKEQFILLNTLEAENKTGQMQTEQSKSLPESFKIDSGVLYFLGAAALAAVIYFLVPDNEPSSEQSYTFGLPVTPK